MAVAEIYPVGMPLPVVIEPVGRPYDNSQEGLPSFFEFSGPPLTQANWQRWKDADELTKSVSSTFGIYCYENDLTFSDQTLDILANNTSGDYNEIWSRFSEIGSLFDSIKLSNIILSTLPSLYSYISLKWRTQFREGNELYVPDDICLDNDLRNVWKKLCLPINTDFTQLFSVSFTQIDGTLYSATLTKTGLDDWMTSVSDYLEVFIRQACSDLIARIPGAVERKIQFQLFREPELKPPTETVTDILLYKMKLCRVLNFYGITEQFIHLFPNPKLNLCRLPPLVISGPTQIDSNATLAIFVDMGIPSKSDSGPSIYGTQTNVFSYWDIQVRGVPDKIPTFSVLTTTDCDIKFIFKVIDYIEPSSFTWDNNQLEIYTEPVQYPFNYTMPNFQMFNFFAIAKDKASGDEVSYNVSIRVRSFD